MRVANIFFGTITLFVLCLNFAVGSEKNKFSLNIISEGYGSWGEAKILYKGDIEIVSVNKIIINIKKIEKELSVDSPESVTEIIPFKTTVSIQEKNKTLDFRMLFFKQKTCENVNKKTLMSSFGLAYHVFTTVIYPFINHDINSNHFKITDDGEMIFKPYVPSKVVCQQIGLSMKGSDYKVGPFIPDKYNVLPVLSIDEDSSGIAISKIKLNKYNINYHLRLIEEFSILPLRTVIMTASRENAIKKELNIISEVSLTFDELKSRYSSFNRYRFIVGSWAENAKK